MKKADDAKVIILRVLISLTAGKDPWAGARIPRFYSQLCCKTAVLLGQSYLLSGPQLTHLWDDGGAPSASWRDSMM